VGEARRRRRASDDVVGEASALYPRDGTDATEATRMAYLVVVRCMEAWASDAKHCAVDTVRTWVVLMESRQGGFADGWMSDLQIRCFAAFLLGASDLDPALDDWDIAPQWFLDGDRELFDVVGFRSGDRDPTPRRRMPRPLTPEWARRRWGAAGAAKSEAPVLGHNP